MPEAERGSASGSFFAFFDVGVGAGGPLLGGSRADGAVVAGAIASAASCVVLTRRPA